MLKLLQILILSLCITPVWAEKVLLMTYVHSRPDFIELHVKTFKAFLLDDYEYVVFNDAPNDGMCRQIEDMCKKHNVRYFRVPEHHARRQQPGARHCDGIRYSLDIIGLHHQGIVAMVDADMFLIKPLSIKEYIRGYDFIGGYQTRTNGSFTATYTSPCLTLMDMRTLPNKETLSYEGCVINGLSCDVGGTTYYYFKNNPDLKMKWYTAVSKDTLPHDADQLRDLGYDNNQINFLLTINRAFGFEFHGDTHFIHFYAGGSNWPGYSPSYIQEKTRLLNELVDQQVVTYSPPSIH